MNHLKVCNLRRIKGEPVAGQKAQGAISESHTKLGVLNSKCCGDSYTLTIR
jgi:hypothetical protein